MDRATAGDWRPTYLAGGLLFSFVALLALPPPRSFFGLVPLGSLTYLVIAGIVVAWALILRVTWRAHLLERFLGVDLQPPHAQS